MVSLGLRTVPVVGLLALLPVLAYTLTRDLVVSLSVVSVLVIAVSLYVMFLPSEREVRATGVDSDAESHDSFGQ